MFHTPSLFRRFKLLRKWSFSLLRRYALISKPRFVVERRMGVLMLLDQRDKVDLNLLCGGVWEADRIEYLEGLVRAHRRGRRCVFLDVGAHGALYSLVLDRRLSFDRIVVFEPEPISLAQIGANVAINGLQGKTEIVAKAASSRAGLAPFLVAEAGNRGQSHLVDRGLAKSVEVETTPIDEVIDEADALIVAKIDVEGHENEVLLGMRATIGKNFAIVQVEKNGEDLQRLQSILAECGMTHVHSIGQDHYFLKADVDANLQRP
jgi:FkbM family methyltransferase